MKSLPPTPAHLRSRRRENYHQMLLDALTSDGLYLKFNGNAHPEHVLLDYLSEYEDVWASTGWSIELAVIERGNGTSEGFGVVDRSFAITVKPKEAT